MKKKGFTLIELLAVIVILAIIALIATPLVLNYVNKARNETIKTSFNNYIKSVELRFAQSLLDNDPLEINKNHNVNDLAVDIKGSKPNSGYVFIDNNGVVSKAEVCINNKTITLLNNNITLKNECNENIPVQNPNLLENSLLKDNSEGWNFNPGAERDDEVTFNQCIAVKNNQVDIGMFASNRGMYNNYLEGLNPGEKISVSYYYKVNDKTTFDGNLRLRIQYYDSTNAIIETHGEEADITPVNLVENTFTRVSTSSIIPQNTQKLRVFINIAHNGTVWYACPKLEIGDVTDFVPHNNELNPS